MEIKKEPMIDRIAYWLLCAIVFDCAAFGGGAIIEIMGIDFRMVLFGLFFVASLPALFRNLKRIMCNGYFAVLLLWGIWLIVSTVRGILAGNRLDTILSAWVGFASFGILPGTLAVLTNKERVLRLMKAVCVASALLMLQSLIALIIYNIDLDAFIKLNLLMIDKEIGGCTGVNDSLVRIFMRSHPYMVFGCVCSVYFAVTEEKKSVRLLHCLNMACCLFSLIVSYTRSIYLCVIVSAAVILTMLAIILGKGNSKRIFKVVSTVAGMFLAVLLVCDIIFGALFLSYGVNRTVGFDLMGRLENILGIEHVDRQPGSSDETPTDEDERSDYEDENALNIWSDSIRAQTVTELQEGIKGKLLVGSGMGAALGSRADGYNEYFFLDMLYKTGIIGLVLYIAPILMMLYVVLKDLKIMEKESAMICAVWMAGLLGIVAFSYFNPYLNGSNGITVYCCTIGVFSAINNKQQIKKKRELIS